MNRKIWLAAILFGLGLLAASVLYQPEPKLIYNASPSAPIGFYRIDPVDSFETGTVVAASLAAGPERLADRRGYLPRGTPVIKTVRGVGGDTYCVSSGVFTVNGRDYPIATKDRQGRALPQLHQGCRDVAADHILLLSDAVGTSFDSRYFGEVPAGNIIGEATYLGDEPAGPGGTGAGARALGAQGKIKVPGAAPGLRRCLHIDFEGAAQTGSALLWLAILNGCGRFPQRYFPMFHGASQSI